MKHYGIPPRLSHFVNLAQFDFKSLCITAQTPDGGRTKPHFPASMYTCPTAPTAICRARIHACRDTASLVSS